MALALPDALDNFIHDLRSHDFVRTIYNTLMALVALTQRLVPRLGILSNLPEFLAQSLVVILQTSIFRMLLATTLCGLGVYNIYGRGKHADVIVSISILS